MRRTLAVLAVILALPLTVAACLWDRDTVADEARGRTDVVSVLIGRFERNPPLYYSMRLERVAKLLQAHPEFLDAYDDAGVACDRLGLGAEAIAWMEKKKAQIDGLDAKKVGAIDVKDQLYRYHANLGTFLVHRWARHGADRAKIDEVKAARDEIAKALAINPNAHFGREKYQLKALEWLIDPPPVEDERLAPLPNLLGWSFGDIYGVQTEPKDAHEAVRGLAGLIALGNAWESVDVFHALNVALQRDSVGYERGRDGGRNTLAYIAYLRCLELIDAGKGSMLPGAPKGAELTGRMGRPDFIGAEDLFDTAYPKLRAEADAWHEARTAFMMGRLKAGRHPDTDHTFWHGYVQRPAPRLPEQSVPGVYMAKMRHRQNVALLVLFGTPTLVIGVALFLGMRWSSRAKRARAKEIVFLPDGV